MLPHTGRLTSAASLLTDGVFAGSIAAAVAVSLGTQLHAKLGALAIRADSPTRWLVVAAIAAVARLATTRLQRRDRNDMYLATGRMLMLAAFAAMASALAASIALACGGLDSAGYLGAADLLSRGHLTEFVPVATLLPFDAATVAAAPLGWVPAARPFFIAPEFPLGFPSLLVPALLLNRSAPFYVVPCLAVGTVALAHSFAKREWDAETALLGAALVATSPVFFTMAIQPMSDVPASFWLLLGTLAAWRQPRPRPMIWAIASGMAMLTRPPLLLAALVSAAIAGWRRREMLIGGAVVSLFVCALLAAQWHMYGNPLVSGHGPGSQLFTAAAAPHNIVAQAKWLMITHTPLTIPAFMLAFRAQRRTAVRSLLVFLAVAAPYVFYAVRFDDFEMNRFLLPGWLLVLIACAGGIVSVVRASPAKARLVSGVLALAAAAGSLLFLSSNRVLDFWQQEMKYPLVGAWLRANTSSNAVFIASLHSGSIKFYTGRPTLNIAAIPSDAIPGTVAALERSDFTPIVVLESGPETVSFLDRLHSDPGVSYWPLGSVRGTTIMRLGTDARASQPR